MESAPPAREIRLWYIFVLTYRIHFEVDQFVAGQCDDNLSLIDRTFGNRFFAGRFPIVHTFVGTDVTNAIGKNL